MAKPKRNSMTVATLKDMVELVNNNTEAFDTAIRKLVRKNRTTKLFGVAALVFACYTAYECRKQEEELYKLSIRVKKLENKEGE